MTKWSVSLLALGLTACLAACGGGGSSSGGFTPNPGPSISPTTSPTNNPASRAVTYTWTGPLHPSASTAVKITGGSGDPVMDGVCNPQVESAGCVGYAQPQITVTETGATPSASPSMSPPQNVVLSPEPNATPYTYMLDPIVSASPGSYTINVKFADGTSGTVPLNVYEHPAIGCSGSGTIGSMPAGWSFDNNSAETTVADSDIYVTGPNCPGEFADPAAPSNGYQIHTPYGATEYYFNQIDFATVNSSMIASPQTAWTFSGASSPVAYGFLIGHTKSGGTFALVITESWNNGPNPPATDGDYFSADVKYATMGQPFAY